MRRNFVVLICAASLAAAGALHAAGEGAKATAYKDGKPTATVISRYRVTAGGSAVEETLFGGTPHEMITIYNLDGDVLS